MTVGNGESYPLRDLGCLVHAGHGRVYNSRCVSVSHIANVRGVMSLILYRLSKKATMQSNKFTSKECKTALTSLSSVFSCGK